MIVIRNCHLKKKNRTNTDIVDINILESEIADIFGSLKVNKACGPDGTSHRMLKYTCKSKRKAMNRNWGNQKANPALKTKTGNK